MKKIINEIWAPVIIVAFLSGVISFSVGRYLLNKEINYDVRKARIDIIKNVEELFAQSEVVWMLLDMTASENRLANNISKVCINAISNGEKVNHESCDVYRYTKSQSSYMQDAYIFRAKYNSLLRLTKIYFCNKSGKRFDSLNKNNDWWSVYNASLRKEVLDTMYQELECKTN